MKQMISSLLNVFYPNNCVICGESLVRGEEQVCTLCLNDIPRTDYHLKESNPVEMRFWGKVDVERASSFLFFHKGSVFQQVIHDLKYRGNKEIGVLFGKIAAADLLDSIHFMSVDLIIPVPLHRKKEANRGYNQSWMIAKGMSQVMKKEIEDNCLFRVKEKTTQTKKGVFERYENMIGVFEIRNKERLENKHILLVDDVLTTGSTIEACVQVLQEAEGVQVSVFTLALSM